MERQTGQGTALITGASSGIGEVFARQLAKRGYNLILVARRKERLEKIAGGLTEQFKIRAEAYPADLSNDDGIYAVSKRISDCQNLTMLVNNAGFGAMGSFPDNDWSIHADSHSVMLNAVIKLTHTAIIGMIERKRGDIINVSSVAGFLSSPGSETYCAIKAYLNTFSKALNGEVNKHDVRVQALCPGFTHTEFHATKTMNDFEKSDIPKWMWLDADYVVRQSLKCLSKNRSICIPSFRYKLIVTILRNRMIGAIIAKFARRPTRKK